MQIYANLHGSPAESWTGTSFSTNLTAHHEWAIPPLNPALVLRAGGIHWRAFGFRDKRRTANLFIYLVMGLWVSQPHPIMCWHAPRNVPLWNAGMLVASGVTLYEGQDMKAIPSRIALLSCGQAFLSSLCVLPFLASPRACSRALSWHADDLAGRGVQSEVSGGRCVPCQPSAYLTAWPRLVSTFPNHFPMLTDQLQ